MPQIRIEATPSLLRRLDLTPLLAEIHHAIVAHAGGARLEDCKSRVYTLEQVYQGDGSTPSAMFHADVKLLSGRTLEMRQAVGQAVLAAIDRHVGPHARGFSLQTSVEVLEMPRETFAKTVHGA